MPPEITSATIPVACFAPTLTDALLGEYSTLIHAQPYGPVRDALLECLAAVQCWWELPVSKRTDGARWVIQHQGKTRRYQETPLEEDHSKEGSKLWDLIPWSYELAGMQQVFDGIPAEEKTLRTCAFHLLWHVKELDLNREPLTQDVLQS